MCLGKKFFITLAQPLLTAAVKGSWSQASPRAEDLGQKYDF